jgi:hypothetical protein
MSLGIALTRTEDGDSPRAGLDVLEEAPAHDSAPVSALTIDSASAKVAAGFGSEVAVLSLRLGKVAT